MIDFQERIDANPRRRTRRSAADAALDRAKRSEAYLDTRDEYERIRALREISPIAAHLRERRFELGLIQEEVARAAARPIVPCRGWRRGPISRSYRRCSG